MASPSPATEVGWVALCPGPPWALQEDLQHLWSLPTACQPPSPQVVTTSRASTHPKRPLGENTPRTNGLVVVTTPFPDPCQTAAWGRRNVLGPTLRQPDQCVGCRQGEAGETPSPRADAPWCGLVLPEWGGPGDRPAAGWIRGDGALTADDEGTSLREPGWVLQPHLGQAPDVTHKASTEPPWSLPRTRGKASKTNGGPAHATPDQSPQTGRDTEARQRMATASRD